MTHLAAFASAIIAFCFAALSAISPSYSELSERAPGNATPGEDTSPACADICPGCAKGSDIDLGPMGIYIQICQDPDVSNGQCDEDEGSPNDCTITETCDISGTLVICNTSGGTLWWSPIGGSPFTKLDAWDEMSTTYSEAAGVICGTKEGIYFYDNNQGAGGTVAHWFATCSACPDDDTGN